MNITYMKVRDFDGEFHPYVADMEGTKFYIEPHQEYKVLGTCEWTGQTVIEDKGRLLMIQSIDCEYTTRLGE